MGASLDPGLVNAWQRDFPLVPRPFAEIAARCGSTEAQVLEEFKLFQSSGLIDRVGPVFRPRTVGASILAAMAVPPERLEEVAARIGHHAGVNHSYEREHSYNLWFVVTGPDEAQVQSTLAVIERESGLPALRLPLEEEFHIDLGFDLNDHAVPRAPRQVAVPVLSAEEKRLVARIAAGLPLLPRPYAQFGLPEETVIATLRRWLELGIVRRIGAVLRHRRLGYEANAMLVWDVPDDEVRAAGRRLAADAAVTLCYLRARAAPEWPYNLYCMVHGRERSRVVYEVKRINLTLDLDRYPRLVLFSNRCFMQRAAHYG
jgi:DNA-binding Lrp family transcriptional regulator